MTRGAITKLADRLIEKGLVLRESNPDDGRAHRLALTSAGSTLVPRLARIADANDAAFFAALTAAERHQLKKLLRSMAAAHGLHNAPTD